jgi:hypothetical protein
VTTVRSVRPVRIPGPRCVLRELDDTRDHLLVRGDWWDSVRYAILATDPVAPVGSVQGGD